MRRRLFTILSAISLVLCAATATCWALSAMGYQRAFVTAKWDDRQTNIQLYYMSATGWRDSTFLNGNVIYQWSANSAQSLDPMRQLLRKKFGDRNQTTWHWIPLPECVLMPLGGGTASQGGELYEAPISEITFACALLPLIWLAWQIYRKWRKRGADPAAIECEACGYDMRATPERCPECGARKC